MLEKYPIGCNHISAVKKSTQRDSKRNNPYFVAIILKIFQNLIT